MTTLKAFFQKNITLTYDNSDQRQTFKDIVPYENLIFTIIVVSLEPLVNQQLTHIY